MKRALLGFAFVSWIAALVMVPLCGLANGALKLRVMSSYNELRVNGVINEDQLPRVGWDKLLGTDLQKSHEFFLGSATGFYSRIAWFATVILIANGGVLLLAYKNHRWTESQSEFGRASEQPPAGGDPLARSK
ncbi:MAG: hypothetical protein WCQ21_19055 [Verrucomicrobiota bacterium]